MREIFLSEGFPLTPNQELLFQRYVSLILSSPINITSIKDPKEIVYRHFIDSLELLKFIDFQHFENLLDVGTGGGFPGIPLKIAFPHVRLFLLESSLKKVNFLKSVISNLAVDEVYVLPGRAEDLARDPNLREKMDIVVSRAVAPLRTLIEITIPFLKEGMLMVAYKGKGVFDEIESSGNALRELRAEIERVEEYHIKGIDFKGYLVFIRKKEETPLKYPRRSGIPFKRPL